MFVRKGSKVKFFDIVTCKEFAGEVMAMEKRMERKYYWVKDEEKRSYRIEKWQIISKIKVLSPTSIGTIFISPIYPPPDAPRPSRNNGIGTNPPPTTPKPGVPGEKKKCEYCEGKRPITKHNPWEIIINKESMFIFHQGEYLSKYDIKIKYCPFCGGKIEEVANE